MTPFLQLIFSLMVIIFCAKLGGWLADRAGQPAVLGELLVGLFLGPSLLDLLHQSFLVDPAHPALLEETVFELAEMGVVCLMFLAGLEANWGELLRAGRVAALAGLLGVIAPLLLGGVTAYLFGYEGRAAFFIGIILTATSVSISAQTLLQLGKLRSREGLALLGAAVVDDLLVILLLSVFISLTDSSGTPAAILWIVVKMTLYLGVALVVAFGLLPRLAGWVDTQPISEGLASLVLVATLAFAWSAEALGGLAAITGAFIAGLGFGRSHLRDEIERAMHTITFAFFVPIFFVSIGLHTDLHQLTAATWPLALLLVLVAMVSKLLGCGLGALAGGFKPREAVRVGVGMISRGEVGLIVATVGVSLGLITTEIFSIVTLIVLLTTLVTPPLLRMTFSRKELGRA